MAEPAILALADGSLFRGVAIGAPGRTVGEVVFNTAMTGYQEILTDPSYARQIVTLTHPHIGNTGVNAADVESGRPHAAGLVIRDLPLRSSNWRSEQTLSEYLEAHGIVAIAGLDTRRLTRVLRDKGAQDGCIVTGRDADPDQAMREARDFPGLKGMDLAREVTTAEAYAWTEGGFDLNEDRFTEARDDGPLVVAYDFGVKRNILRLLVEQGCRVKVVPATTNASDVLAMKPDGVMLSNGPGDPEPCDYAIRAIRELIRAEKPVFGICLGHQLLGLAVGGRSLKMKFGHHGANHPVVDVDTGQVMISSQNHGFAIDEDSLPGNVRTTHRSLFDGTLQGLELTDAPAFSFQGHPEASPGPHDVRPLFEKFMKLMGAKPVPFTPFTERAPRHA